MRVETGAELGDYRILSRIGTGAFGEVFEGEHRITRRRDAIKILSEGLHAPEQEQRFLREIQVQASLHHPNIATVHGAFRTPHGLALVLELISGEPLSVILDRGRLPMRVGIGYVLEILAGLAYAHAHGVVHRDIKPENIMITPDGSAKLTDFGLARSAASPRLTQSGELAGSPCYMAPEQAVGSSPVDARCDTYSAGVVLYEIVTGRPPFVGETSFAVLLAHQSSVPQPPVEIEPAIGKELNQVILKALEKDAALRFQTAGEFRAALQGAMPDALPRTEAPVLPSRAVRSRGRRLSLVACACSVTITGVLLGVMRNGTGVVPTANSSKSGKSAAVDSRPAPDAMPADRPTRPPDAAPAAPPSALAGDEGSAIAKPKPAPNRPRRPKKGVRSSRTNDLRITGAYRAGDLQEAPPAEKSPAMPTATSVTETSVTEAPAPALTASQPPLASKPDEDKSAAPKRRHVVVRTLQRVFRLGRALVDPEKDQGPGTPANKQPSSQSVPVKSP
jgi:serine/threonine-protein kinase